MSNHSDEPRPTLPDRGDKPRLVRSILSDEPIQARETHHLKSDRARETHRHMPSQRDRPKSRHNGLYLVIATRQALSSLIVPLRRPSHSRQGDYPRRVASCPSQRDRPRLVRLALVNANATSRDEQAHVRSGRRTSQGPSSTDQGDRPRHVESPQAGATSLVEPGPPDPIPHWLARL